MKYVVFSVEVESKEVEVPDTVPEIKRKDWAYDKAYEQPDKDWDRSATETHGIVATNVDGSAFPEEEVPSELQWLD